MTLEGKTMVVSDEAAFLFEQCRKILVRVKISANQDFFIGAVTSEHPCNAETMIVICTAFLKSAGYE